MALNATPVPCSRAWLDYNMLVLPIPTVFLIVGVLFLLLGSMMILKVQYSELMANIYWALCGACLIAASIIIRFVVKGSTHSTTSRSIKKAFCGICGSNTKSSSRHQVLRVLRQGVQVKQKVLRTLHADCAVINLVSCVWEGTDAAASADTAAVVTANVSHPSSSSSSELISSALAGAASAQAPRAARSTGRAAWPRWGRDPSLRR